MLWVAGGESVWAAGSESVRVAVWVAGSESFWVAGSESFWVAGSESFWVADRESPSSDDDAEGGTHPSSSALLLGLSSGASPAAGALQRLAGSFESSPAPAVSILRIIL